MSSFLRPRGAPRPASAMPGARVALSILALTAVLSAPASGQESVTELPEITVTTSTPKAKGAAKPKARPAPTAASAPPQSLPTDAEASGAPAPGSRSGSLSVPTTAEAAAEIARTPGAVEVVPDTAYKGSTPAVTLKDALDYVPGVFVQPKWGEDSRLSIRGSGLSRNFHLRSIQLYMDGIPINTADGYGDFQEIDPTAYRYIEVYKGANALRFGANSLGGAINFVMPTGYDADLFGARLDVGSFGFRKLAASSGAVSGPVDYFMTGTWQEADGFREHSDGESVRGSLNVGFRLSENAETRFYVNATDVEQRIPGQVTREQALTSPKQAAAVNLAQDWQRNLEAIRIANKTSLRLTPGTLVEFGAYYFERDLDHPIAIYIDYAYEDYGAFGRVTDARRIAGYKNRFVGGVDVHNGEIDAKLYANVGNATKGPAPFSDTLDKSKNTSIYAENSFFFAEDVALVTGVQYLHATRDRLNNFSGATSGTEFDLWSPKAGLLWDVTPWAQVFANISRSAEVPSFGEGSTTQAVDFTRIRPQRATTYEIGTRGRTESFHWDLAVYRANIDDELQCFTNTVGTCDVLNADKTIHQGVELGFGAALARSLLVGGYRPDELWLNVAYTYNDFRFDDDAQWGNNELPGAPPHFVRAELIYKHPSGLYAGPNVEWVPEASFADNANSLKSDSYALLGAKIGFDNGGPITAYIEARNLTDEAYIASHAIATVADDTTRLFEPGNGRAIYGGVQVKW